MSQNRRPGASPFSHVYMPSSPPPETEGIVAFNAELRAKPLAYLATKLPRSLSKYSKRTNNRRVFSQAKKAVYRRWLENPGRELEGETLAARAQDRNARYDALKFYELDQGRIYCKAPILNEVVIGLCKYVWLSTNAFDIIADEHRGIKHFGICCSTLFCIV
jgi:hypothetical protein